jgi:hypothetical protein
MKRKHEPHPISSVSASEPVSEPSKKKQKHLSDPVFVNTLKQRKQSLETFCAQVQNQFDRVTQYAIRSMPVNEIQRRPPYFSLVFDGRPPLSNGYGHYLTEQSWLHELDTLRLVDNAKLSNIPTLLERLQDAIEKKMGLLARRILSIVFPKHDVLELFSCDFTLDDAIVCGLLNHVKRLYPGAYAEWNNNYAPCDGRLQHIFTRMFVDLYLTMAVRAGHVDIVEWVVKQYTKQVGPITAYKGLTDRKIDAARLGHTDVLKVLDTLGVPFTKVDQLRKLVEANGTARVWLLQQDWFCSEVSDEPSVVWFDFFTRIPSLIRTSDQCLDLRNQQLGCDAIKIVAKLIQLDASELVHVDLRDNPNILGVHNVKQLQKLGETCAENTHLKSLRMNFTTTAEHNILVESFVAKHNKLTEITPKHQSVCTFLMFPSLLSLALHAVYDHVRTSRYHPDEPPVMSMEHVKAKLPSDLYNLWMLHWGHRVSD